MKYLKEILNYIRKKPFKAVFVSVASLFGFYLLLIGLLFGVASPVFNWYVWSTINELDQALTKSRAESKHWDPDKPTYSIPLSVRVDDPRKHNEMKAEIRKAQSKFGDIFVAKLEKNDVKDEEVLDKFKKYAEKVKEFEEEFPDDPGPVAFKINLLKSKSQAYYAIGEEKKAKEVLNEIMDYIHNIPQKHFYHQAVSARVKEAQDYVHTWRERYSDE